METYVPIYLHLMGKVLGGCSKVHYADDSGSVVAGLEACGMSRDGLPTSLGGTWSSDNVDDSRANEKTPAPVDSGALADLADAAQHAIIEERKARKRHLDVVYARKRRQREKGGEKSLQLECDEMKKVNLRLRNENDRLETMLAEARTKVAFVELGMPINPYQSRMSIPRIPAAVASRSLPVGKQVRTLCLRFAVLDRIGVGKQEIYYLL
jgi:hypothetical protein